MRPPVITMVSQILARVSKPLVRDFGEIAGLQNSEKAESFLLAAERRTEALLHDAFHKAYPKHNLLMEDSGFIDYAEAGSPLWIIDPIDGSKNFLHGLPYFSTSVALKENNQLVAAMIFDPLRNELFWAYRSLGAYLNQTRLRVSKRTSLSECIFAMGTGQLKGPAHAFHSLSAIGYQVSGLRAWGATSLNLAYLAAGQYDGFWDYHSRPWDMAAGILMVKEAGGTLTNFEGRFPSFEGDSLIAGNQATYQFLASVLASPATSSSK
jgi:myo-inositol-1(or 4)-monophosphatase